MALESALHCHQREPAGRASSPSGCRKSWPRRYPVLLIAAFLPAPPVAGRLPVPRRGQRPGVRRERGRALHHRRRAEHRQAGTFTDGDAGILILAYVWRFITDPISHACWAGLTGYFIGLAVSGTHKWYRVFWVGLAGHGPARAQRLERDQQATGPGSWWWRRAASSSSPTPRPPPTRRQAHQSSSLAGITVPPPGSTASYAPRHGVPPTQPPSPPHPRSQPQPHPQHQNPPHTPVPATDGRRGTHPRPGLPPPGRDRAPVAAEEAVVGDDAGAIPARR